MTEQDQINMLGTTFNGADEEIEGAMAKGMYILSILSDVQAVLERDPETARQWINKAKYLLSEKVLPTDSHGRLL